MAKAEEKDPRAEIERILGKVHNAILSYEEWSDLSKTEQAALDLVAEYRKLIELENPAESKDPTTGSAIDKQVGGGHYKAQGIQPIEFSMSNELNFAEGSVIKYVHRHRRKNGAEDIKKAIHYLEFILEYEYNTKAD